MKKIILHLLGFYLIVGLNSCGCKEKPLCEMPFLGEKYFGQYSGEAKYWIYLNQDSTKTDSVYIQNYVSETLDNHPKLCIEWERRTVDLVSQYISEEKRHFSCV